MTTANTTVNKPTKKDNYAAIIAILEAAEANGMVLEEGYENITFESLKKFIDHEVELLDNKAAAAQKRAAAKKVEGDALRERVFSCLTAEPQTITAIVKVLGDPDISAQMVTSRLTQLCAEDVQRAVKETIKVPASTEGGKAKTLSAYRLA